MMGINKDDTQSRLTGSNTDVVAVSPKARQGTVQFRLTGDNKKELGQYVTPKGIVCAILDSVGYTGRTVLSARIFEPCFGSGVFLVKIAERIIAEGRAAGLSDGEIANILQSNVYGIEKDEKLYSRAIVRLNNLLRSHKIPLSEWTHLVNGDTLMLYENYCDMDFVVGNPPFVRIHNIPMEYRGLAKSFRFSSKGLPDIYIVFYEIGISLLKSHTGRLGYISPNSFLRNSSQQDFRDFLIDNRYISAVYDFKDTTIFENASTYNCICILDKANSGDYEIKCGSSHTDRDEYSFTYSEFCAMFKGKAWNLCQDSDKQFLEANRCVCFRLKDICNIQCGVTTQADDIYIGKAFLDCECSVPYKGKGAMDETKAEKSFSVYFKNGRNEVAAIEAAALHRCVKGSRFAGVLDNDYIVFPYDNGYGSGQNGYSPLMEETFISRYPLAYKYLLSMKDKLLARDKDKNADWFLFGRNQGLKNSSAPKIVFKNFVSKNTERIIPYILEADVIVYSGVYVVQKNENYTLPKLCKVISSKDFIRYIKLTGKNLSGGYVAIGTRQAQDFGVDFTGFYINKGA